MTSLPCALVRRGGPLKGKDERGTLARQDAGSIRAVVLAAMGDRARGTSSLNRARGEKGGQDGDGPPSRARRTCSDEGLVFALPFGTRAVFVLVAIAAGVLGAIFPARRASRLNVLEALRTSESIGPRGRERKLHMSRSLLDFPDPTTSPAGRFSPAGRIAAAGTLVLGQRPASYGP
jgi:hypothetical protein